MLPELTGHLDSIRTSERKPNAPRFAISPTALEVKAVKYDAENKPMWGDRLALYAPEAHDITLLDAPSWQLFDAIKTSALSIEEIAEKNGTSPVTVLETVQALQDRFIVYQEGTTTTIPFNPDLMSRGELYLETTEACNFKCGGCATGIDQYERGQAQTMTPETLAFTLTKTVESAARHGMRSFRIKWAGGEALLPLSLRLIEQGQTIIADLQKQYPDIELSQVILTNGTQFNEAVVDKIAQWGMPISVSLWGLDSQNDILRGARRQQDTYQNIIQGIRLLHERGIRYSINHVVAPGNAQDFDKFLSAFWDTENDNFIAKDWTWDEHGRQPLRVGLSFYRAQTPIDLQMMQSIGYDLMVKGIRGGLKTIADLIDRGIRIQSLSRIDYLQLFGLISSPCGSGFNYLAAGPRGWSSCHEGLFAMDNNLSAVRQHNHDVIELVNQDYAAQRQLLVGANIDYGNLDERTSTILALHGGAGCPRTARDENQGILGKAASSAERLYAPILEELIALETMRRLRETNFCNSPSQLRRVG